MRDRARAGFLTFSTVDIWDWMVLCVEPSCACRMLSVIPTLYLFDASCNPPLVMTTKTVSKHWQMSPGG